MTLNPSHPTNKQQQQQTSSSSLHHHKYYYSPLQQHPQKHPHTTHSLCSLTLFSISMIIYSPLIWNGEIITTPVCPKNVEKIGIFSPMQVGIPIKRQHFKHYQVLLGNCALLAVKQHEKLRKRSQGERPFGHHSKSVYIIILFKLFRKL